MSKYTLGSGTDKFNPEDGSTGKPPGLHKDVRLALQSHRHDLAGRVQAVLGSAELLANPSSTLPGEILEAVSLLNDIVAEWRRELHVLDCLLEGSLSDKVASSAAIRKVIPSADLLPQARWDCEPESLAAAIRHAYKTVGRSGFQRAHMTVTFDDDLVVEVVAGDVIDRDVDRVRNSDDSFVGSRKDDKRVAEVFAGDINAALTEAHAHFARVALSCLIDEFGTAIRFTISHS